MSNFVVYFLGVIHGVFATALIILVVLPPARIPF